MTAQARRASGGDARPPAARNWLFVLNPVAGRGWHARHAGAFQQAVAGLGLNARIVVTAAPGDGVRLTAEGVAAGADLVVAVGGDGTVHEVVCGLMQSGAAASGLAFGVVPVGTGNDFAKTLAMPRNWRRSLEALVRGRLVACDVGQADFLRDGRPASSHFINVAGAGFDGFVLSGLGARTVGKWSYLVQLLKSWRAWVSPSFDLEARQVSISRRKGLVIFFALGRYCGGGMEVAPEATIDSGEAGIVFVSDMTTGQLLHDLPKLFNGRIAESAHTTCWSAAEVGVTTDPPSLVEADGELLGTTPARFRVLPRGLAVLVP